MEYLPTLLGLLAAMASSAFFSASETAVFNLSDADLATIDRRHPRAGSVMRRLRLRGYDVLMTVLFGNMIINLTLFNVGHGLALEVGEKHGPFLASVVDVAVVISAILFAEIIPKAIGLNATVRVATATAIPLSIIERILRIPRRPFSHIARVIAETIAPKGEEGDVTSADLGRALGAAARRGEFGADEHEWLSALLDLDEAPVREVMTPRVDVVAFDLRGGRVEFEKLHLTTYRNKIPVHEGSIDRLTGMIVVAEALSRPNELLTDLVRAVPFVPESASVADALSRLRESNVRLAVVVDEYGGTEGIVTLEDIVEAVIGDLADEGEVRWDPVVENPDGSWLVDAALPIHPARRAFGLPPEGGVATIGGLVASRLGRMPRVGDEIISGHVAVRVAEMKGRRPDRLVLRHVSSKGEVAPR